MAGKAGRQVYRSARWRAVRRQVFRRDGWRCVECGSRVALECDHVETITTGGDWFRLDNLRTLCRGCHIAKSAEELRKPLSRERSDLMELAKESTHAATQ